jgi:predicted permease
VGSNAPPYPCYEILHDNNHYFSGMAAFGGDRFKVTIDGRAEQINGQYASGSYFQILGVKAIYGRVLLPADDSQIGRGGPDGPTAVISYALWKRRFGMSPSVLGKTILVGTKWVTIVGVTAPEFFGLEVGSPVDLTIPMMLSENNLREKASWWFSAVGRLKDGATPAQSRADLDRLFQAYMREIRIGGETRKYFDRIELMPANRGLESLRHRFSKPLLIAMTIVGLELLIGCANVANLLLARAANRQSEISIRLAIGAARGRIVRQMLTEGLLLVAAGAVVGVVFARWGVALLVGFFAGVRHRILLDPHFDIRVLAFIVCIAVLTGLLFSIAPALHATRPDATKPQESERPSSAKPRVRMGQGLVVLQVALSLVLLCGAALFVRTLHNLGSLEAGFSRNRVLTMRVDATTTPESSTTPPDKESVGLQHARLARIWNDLVNQVAALPGVKLAAAATLSPMSGRDRGVNIAVTGASALAEYDRGIHLNQVTPGYFETMGIQLMMGRSFTSRDQGNSPKVAILDNAAARFYFHDSNPLGKRVSFPGQQVTDDYEIVGIVGDARYESLREPAGRMVYVPIQQSLDPIRGVVLTVDGRGNESELVLKIREAVRRTVPGGFLTNIATIEQQIGESLVQERLLAILASFFGALALVLACIGLYGVMSYAVARRTREIAIRMAVGARRGTVIWMVLRVTLALIGIGVVFGIPGILMSMRFVKAELFGVTPGDPATIAFPVLILLGIAAAAGYLPVRRASRVDPMMALRYE